MDSDEEDFVFYGTPIEREEEVTSRKKKAVADASGLLRTLPPWKQEVILHNLYPYRRTYTILTYCLCCHLLMAFNFFYVSTICA